MFNQLCPALEAPLKNPSGEAKEPAMDRFPKNRN